MAPVLAPPYPQRVPWPENFMALFLTESTMDFSNGARFETSLFPENSSARKFDGTLPHLQRVPRIFRMAPVLKPLYSQRVPLPRNYFYTSY